MANNSTEPAYDYFYRTYSIVEYVIHIIGAALYAKVLWLILKHRKTQFNNTFYILILHLGVAECVYLIFDKLGEILSALGFSDPICEWSQSLGIAGLMSASAIMLYVR